MYRQKWRSENQFCARNENKNPLFSCTIINFRMSFSQIPLCYPLSDAIVHSSAKVTSVKISSVKICVSMLRSMSEILVQFIFHFLSPSQYSRFYYPSFIERAFFFVVDSYTSLFLKSIDSFLLKCFKFPKSSTY